MKTTFNPILLKKGTLSSFKELCMTAVCSVSNNMMHPRNISCSVSKFPGSTPLLPCSCVEGNSSRGTYMFTKPPTVFNIHKSTLHLYLINKREQKRKPNPYLHTEVCIQREKKINMETFQKLQKSVFSNQAHHTPHHTDILYIWVVLPKDTRASTPWSSITAGTIVGHLEL